MLSGEMKILVFGSYDSARHPRVQVMIDGFRAWGDEVVECNRPLGLDTEERVRILRRPRGLLRFLATLAGIWIRLWADARMLGRPDAVIVGYMGHFDVHLARILFPRVPLVLDHLLFAWDTAIDRRVRRGVRIRLLRALDSAAVAAADVPVVDTPEHLAMLPERHRPRSIVVPVGAGSEWFSEPTPLTDPMRVVFYGLFTPLQGTEVIARAIAALAGMPIEFTIVGMGQDYRRARSVARLSSRVEWIDWMGTADLQELTRRHHVCLGIFGSTDKARRVVPNKVYQGAAAGCAIVTSDTPPQRRAFGGAAIYVAPGDSHALTRALVMLHEDEPLREQYRHAAHRQAKESFSPATVVIPVRSALERKRVEDADKNAVAARRFVGPGAGRS